MEPKGSQQVAKVDKNSIQNQPGRPQDGSQQTCTNTENIMEFFRLFGICADTRNILNALPVHLPRQVFGFSIGGAVNRSGPVKGLTGPDMLRAAIRTINMS